MKALRKAFFVVLGFLCLMLLPAAGNAQCVQCAEAPPGFICVPSTTGASGCITDDGNCMLIGPCHHRMAPGESCSVKPLNNPQVSISDSMIREIGATDARLALAVRSVGKIKAEFTEARSNFASIEYTFDDVENQLTQPADSPYYKRLAERVKDSFARGDGFVTYEVSITEGKGNGSFVLSISPVKGGAGIDIQLQRATFGSGKDASDGFKALSYQIR